MNLNIKVAIVILNWNGIDFLKKFLPGVVKESSIEGVEVFIADNASSDDSLLYVRQNFPDVRTIALDKNYGFADGYNKALQQIDAEYFVLLNSDVEVTPQWIQPMMEIMDNNSAIAACMPKIKSWHSKEYFEYAGASGGFIDRFGYTFCRGRIFNNMEKDNGQYDSIKEIFWASGACLFIRASLFKSAGGLDGDFFAHMEEIDLCWRLKNMGYKIAVAPQSVIFHVGGGTLSQQNPKKTYLNFRNNLYLLYKNADPSKLFSIFLIRLILDGVAGLKFLIGLEGKNFVAVLHAHYSFYTTVHKFGIKRKNNLLKFKRYDHSEVYRSSIVYQFYLKQVKEFSMLIFK